MSRSSPGVRLAALALGWLAGVGLQLQQATLAAAAHYAGLVAAAAMLLLFSALSTTLRRRPAATLALCIVAALLAGFGSAGWRAGGRLADALDPALERAELLLTGVVASLPQVEAMGLRFRLDVEQATLQGVPVRVPRRVALGWSSGFDEDAVPTALQTALRPGQRWRFVARLRRPHGQLNPHGRDQELAWFEQGVRATGQVRDAAAAGPAPVRLDDGSAWQVDRWRQQVRDAILRAVPERRAAGVLAALVVGDQGAIAGDDWEVFRNAGVAHLMAISGLHITMFAWLVGAAVRALWSRGTAALWLPAPLAGRWIGLAAAAGYALFSGWGVPAQRTVWMIATAALLTSLGRRWPWLLVLLAAAVVVTALDPWALLQPGFWLSFTAVGILLASGLPAGAQAGDASPPAGSARFAAAAGRLRQAVAGGLRTQAVATIALTPLTLVFFQQVSVVGFAANLVAIPLVTLLVTPLALLGTVVTPLWTLAAALVERFVALLSWLTSWPQAVWTVGAAPAWAQFAGILAGVLLVLPLPRLVRLAALPLLLPLLLPPHELPAEGDYSLLAADVGQGTAVLLRTRSHLLVYDAGPRYSRDSDAGGRVLLPLLRAAGDKRIDLLVLSHRDTDHVGGAAALLRGLPVGRLLSSLDAAHPLLASGVPQTRCEAGQAWQWDGVRFEVLHPPAGRYLQAARPNSLSCVLRVSATAAGRPRSVLLAGDIERADEAALVERYGDALRSRVLIVPHHGSRTSSGAAFLDAVQPLTAVVQAGYLNRFGHPAPDVVGRYRERGAATVLSADCGAWHDGPAEMPLACERDRRRRYWHHPGGSRAAP